MTKRLIIFCASFLLFSFPLLAQNKLLTLKVLYDPDEEVNFGGTIPIGIHWLKDGTHYIERTSQRAYPLVRVDARTGDSQSFFDVDRLRKDLQALPGMTSEAAADLVADADYVVSPQEDSLFFEYEKDLFYFHFSDGRLERLTSTPGEEQEAEFSPDGRMVAFVRDNDLYVVDVSDAVERRLTTDGSALRLNGILDWIYQEEVYGRGHFRAFWWSPDSTRLAFLQLDESRVPEFTVADYLPDNPTYEVERYPRPGEPNPSVRLGTVRAIGGQPRWVDLSNYGSEPILIVRVAWTPDSREVAYQVQNRIQTWLDLNFGDAGTGKSRNVLKEVSPAWVDALGDPTWLPDGSFLWLSQRTGWEHVYHYARDGQLLQAVTSGGWEVDKIYGVDASGQWVYLRGNQASPIGQDIYRVRIDGSALKRLSQRDGTHSALFNDQFSLYLDKWSDINTPPQYRLFEAEGKMVPVVAENPVPALKE